MPLNAQERELPASAFLAMTNFLSYLRNRLCLTQSVQI